MLTLDPVILFSKFVFLELFVQFENVINIFVEIFHISNHPMNTFFTRIKQSTAFKVQ